jgi:hypothetical protein
LNPEDDYPLLDYVVDLNSAESDSLFNMIKKKAIKNAKTEENFNRARKNAAIILKGILQPAANINNYSIRIDYKEYLIPEDLEVPADTTSFNKDNVVE